MLPHLSAALNHTFLSANHYICALLLYILVQYLVDIQPVQSPIISVVVLLKLMQVSWGLD